MGGLDKLLFFVLRLWRQLRKGTKPESNRAGYGKTDLSNPSVSWGRAAFFIEQ